MRTAGADIIVDDVAFQDQSFFQDDVVGAAVNEVVADGAVYLTTAGNSNRILVKNDIAKDVTSYTALSYRPAPCPALTWGGQPVTLTGDCHDFNPSASVTDTTLSYTIGVGQGFYTRLQWGEPWYGVTTDMNFYWVDATGAIQPNPFDPAQQSAGTNDNLTTQKPLELEVPLANQSSTPSTYSLVINRAKGSGTPPLWAYFNAGIGVLIDAEYYTPTNPGDSVDLFGLTSFGHRASASAISVAAVPYDNGSKPQDYSTRGEAIHFFAPISGTVAAAPLALPVFTAKPDVAATDGGANTFFGRAPNSPTNATANWRFFGTSAAAAHAAGVAALILQQAKDVGITMLQSDVAGLLKATARTVGSYGPREVGGGLIDAYAAVQGCGPLPLLSRLLAPQTQP